MDTETVELPMFWFIKDQHEFERYFQQVPRIDKAEIDTLRDRLKDDDRECNKRNGYEN